MNDVFGIAYATVYDTLYSDKDYAGECALLERLFKDYARSPIASVLDLGCGTGGHALPLAGRGLQVTGVDCSAAMLDRAREKAACRAETGRAPPEFVQGDVRSLRLDRIFDAAIMMFAVLGYQHDNDALLATLASVRRHLSPSGLFIFDIWYGPAVVTQRPGERVRTITGGGERIFRTTRTDLDIRAQICHVHFHVLRLSGDRLVDEGREVHAMRFFFDQELKLALAASGFQLESLRAFPDVEREPNETTWNVIGIARAVS